MYYLIVYWSIYGNKTIRVFSTFNDCQRYMYKCLSKDKFCYYNVSFSNKGVNL